MKFAEERGARRRRGVGGRGDIRSERGWNSEKSINENCLFQISLFLVSFVLMSHTSWNNINDMSRTATGLLIAVCNKFALTGGRDIAIAKSTKSVPSEGTPA